MAYEENTQLVDFPPRGARVREHNPVISRLKDDPDVKIGMAFENARITFAKMAKDARQKAGLTQAELAELLNTTQKQISRMESCFANAGDVTIGMAAKYMHACGKELLFEVSENSVKVTSQSPKSKVVKLGSQMEATG